MELGMFVVFLTLKNAMKLGKLAKFFLVFREPRKNLGKIVTSVPSVTNVYYFFMDCRDAYRFVRCGFVYVNVCYGAAFMCGVAHPCCRALVMLPRTRMLPLIYGAAPSHTATLHSAVHLYAAAHPWCRACGPMVSSS